MSDRNSEYVAKFSEKYSNAWVYKSSFLSSAFHKLFSDFLNCLSAGKLNHFFVI